MNSKPNTPLAAAMRRSLAFLRAAPDREAARALHFAQALNAIQKATEHLVLAGQDELALKLVDLRAEADTAFGDTVHAPEAAHHARETAECDRLLTMPQAAREGVRK